MSSNDESGRSAAAVIAHLRGMLAYEQQRNLEMKEQIANLVTALSLARSMLETRNVAVWTAWNEIERLRKTLS